MDRNDKEQGDENALIWHKHVPLPRMLHSIEGHLNRANLSPENLERILPTLIFSLPPSSKLCCRLLRSLPSSSLVWNRLQEGLFEGKYLPLEVMAALYENRVTFLENEIFQVMKCYSQSDCKRYGLYDFTVERFKDVGQCPSRLFGQKFHGIDCEMNVDGSSRRTANFWKNSFIIEAAICSDVVFSLCLRIFFRIAVDAQFSSLFVRIVHDFFSLFLHKLGRDIFKVFPAHLQYIVFLLALPLNDIPGCSSLENDFGVEITQEELLKVVKDEGMVVAQSLLSFFPFWLSALSRNSFLDRYLSVLPKDDLCVT